MGSGAWSRVERARFNVPSNTRHIGDGLIYRSNDPTNSVTALKEAWS